MSVDSRHYPCEKIPKENDLIGKWISLEQSNTDKLTIEFTDKCFIKSLTYYLVLYDTMIFSSETYLYSLDKKQKWLCLFSEEDSDSKSFHEINLNKEKDELTIWGLTPYIPEQRPSKIVFKKESTASNWRFHASGGVFSSETFV